MKLLILLIQATCVLSAGVSISVNTTHINPGDWVTVKFSGVPTADRDACFIAYFVPANASVTPFKPVGKSEWTPPYTTTAPVKWIRCHDCGHDFKKTGAGSHSFRLLNMRQDAVFWLLYDVESPKAIAKTATITFKDSDRPQYVHLSRMQTPTEMRVTWISGSDSGNSTVHYTQGNTETLQTETATTFTFGAESFCGPPAKSQGWFDPGFIHTAVMKNLKPGIPVMYSVGSTVTGFTKQYKFHPAEAPNPHTPLSAIIIADVGATEPDQTQIHWEEPDAYQTWAFAHSGINNHTLACHIGDLSYATGYESKWEIFMNYVEGVAAYMPYMTGLGNHERDWPGSGNDIGGIDSGGECGIATQARFIMPIENDPIESYIKELQGPIKEKREYYSFNQASVHFVMYATELSLGPGSAQYDWLEHDLKSVNRSVTPWVVVMGHRPMYVGHYISPHFQVIEDLMYKYKVDLDLTGHVHYAMATCPAYKGKCMPKGADGYDGVVHAIIGNGGQSLSAPDFSEKYVVYGGAYYGGNELIAESATKLHLNFYIDGYNKLNYTQTITRTWPRKY